MDCCSPGLRAGRQAGLTHGDGYEFRAFRLESVFAGNCLTSLLICLAIILAPVVVVKVHSASSRVFAGHRRFEAALQAAELPWRSTVLLPTARSSKLLPRARSQCYLAQPQAV